jgi:alpha-amylase
LFGDRPEGMWLAERVWEPSMPVVLKRSGIEYIPIDDYHLKRVGVSDDDMVSGYFMTEDKGYAVSLFPGSEKLRYLIPFRDIDELSKYFRYTYENNVNPLLTFADDGEKFGIWPSTYKHCYEKGWLRAFFEFLESSSDWIETATFRGYYDEYHPAGRTYLPTASYREMGQWSLPGKAASEYEGIYEYLGKKDEETANTWIGGGLWRGFFAKYTESNYLHKRMLMVSEKVRKAVRTDSKRGKKAEDHLYRSQCNDAYWHGIFGGLYLPHLRSALWSDLIKAEHLSDNILEKRNYLLKDDIDRDGFQEILIRKSGRYVVFSQIGGGLVEYSLASAGINLTDTMRRQKEYYHEKIKKQAEEGDTGETKTIHERLEIKDRSVLKAMFFDENRRVSFVEHLFNEDIDINDIIRSDYNDKYDLADSLYEFDTRGNDEIIATGRSGSGSDDFKVHKTFKVKRDGISVHYNFDGDTEGIVAIEVNLTFLGSPFSEIVVNKKKRHVKNKGKYANLKNFQVIDNNKSLMVTFSFGKKIDLWHYPVETVSLSEEGAEKVFQGVCLLFILKGDKSIRADMKVSRV